MIVKFNLTDTLSADTYKAKSFCEKGDKDKILCGSSHHKSEPWKHKNREKRR